MQGFIGGTKLTSVEIDIPNANGAYTIYTPETGKKFVVYYVYMMSTLTTKSCNLTYRSGSNNISSVRQMLIRYGVTNVPLQRQLKNSGHPVLIGVDVDEAFVINKAGGGNLRGFALCDSIVA